MVEKQPFIYINGGELFSSLKSFVQASPVWFTSPLIEHVHLSGRLIISGLNILFRVISAIIQT